MRNQTHFIIGLNDGLFAFLFESLSSPDFSAEINDGIAIVHSFESGNMHVVLFGRGRVKMWPVKLLFVLFNWHGENFLSGLPIETVGRTEGRAFHSGKNGVLYTRIWNLRFWYPAFLAQKSDDMLCLEFAPAAQFLCLLDRKSTRLN